MPKLQAAVPQGAPPNALLRVRLPDGREVNVRLPQGLSAGDEFVFEINDDAEVGENLIGKPAAKAPGRKQSEGSGKQTTSSKKSSKKKSRGSGGGSDPSGRRLATKRWGNSLPKSATPRSPRSRSSKV